MVDIVLQSGESGYEAVGKYIRRYWKHNITSTVVVSIGVSYDGLTYELIKDVACPLGFDGVKCLYNWWEGQKYIKLFGIKTLDELDVSGGIYTEDE